MRHPRHPHQPPALAVGLLPASLPSTAHGGGFWLYLPLLAGIELATVLRGSQVGVALHTLLLIGLMLHTSLARHEDTARLALSLTLIPIMRLALLLMPRNGLAPIGWYALALLLVALATALVLYQINLPRATVGLVLHRPLLHLLLLGGAPGLAALQLALLPPTPFPATATPLLSLLLIPLLLLGGVLEEIIMRGAVQATALRLMGPSALVFSALAGSVIQIGASSLAVPLLAFLIGWLFAQIAYLSGSLLGVALLRGLMAVLHWLLLPTLLPTPPAGALATLASYGTPTAALMLALLALLTGLLAWVLLLIGYLCATPNDPPIG